MAKLGNILVGLQVAVEVEGPDKHGACAEHDVIYILHRHPPDQLTPEQVKKLKDANWFWEDDSWQAFV